jgi:hypothetical protein
MTHTKQHRINHLYYRANQWERRDKNLTYVAPYVRRKRNKQANAMQELLFVGLLFLAVVGILYL